MTFELFYDIISCKFILRKEGGILLVHIIIIFIMFVLIFLLFENPDHNKISHSQKKVTHQYLCDFNMYLCLKNKLFLFPPKEISANKRYYTLNLNTKNNLLPHKCINGNGISEKITTCTECINHCSVYSSDIVNLRMSFDKFRKLNNDELNQCLPPSNSNNYLTKKIKTP